MADETIERWHRCPHAGRASRDELVFTIAAGGKRIAMRCRWCGYETTFPQFDIAPPLTWADLQRAVAAHLPQDTPRTECSSRLCGGLIGTGKTMIYHCDGTHPKPPLVPVEGAWHTSAAWTSVTRSPHAGWTDGRAVPAGERCTQETCAEPGYHVWAPPVGSPRYRLGRKLDQTIYEQAGAEPGPDRLLAFGATPATAAEVVELLNRQAGPAS